MLTSPTDLIYGLLSPADASAQDSAQRFEMELAVIELFEQFRNPLLRYVMLFGLSVHDGEEITQEVFLALFRHLQMRRSRRNLRGWIFRVAHNLSLKRRNTNQRWQHTMTSDCTLAEQLQDPAANPEEQASFTQRRQHLLFVVRALPENDQYCLHLRAEGLRYREIAKVLDISLGSVSISLARSLARLTRAEKG